MPWLQRHHLRFGSDMIFLLKDPCQPSIVGFWKNAGTFRRAFSVLLISPMTRTASSEWPPRSKKLSRMPTCSRPSISHQIRARTFSVGVRGSSGAASASRAARPGAATLCGRACRSASAEMQRATRRPTGTYSSAASRQQKAQVARGDDGTGGGNDVGDEALVAWPSSRATTTHRATPGCVPAPPRSRPARCGGRGSSPDDRAGREIRACRRPGAAPGRRCDTSARPARPRTDRPRSARA